MMLKIFQTILIATSVFFTSQCNSSSAVSSQTRPTETPPVNATVTTGTNARAITETSNSEPTDESDVDGKPHDSVITDLNLETILNHPTPEIWFVVPCQDKKDEPTKNCANHKAKVEITLDAEKSVQEFWKVALTFQYKNLMKKYNDAQEMYDDSMNYTGKINLFEKRFQEFLLESPNGTRRFSNDEASKVTAFIVKNARETVQTAKENLKQ